MHDLLTLVISCLFALLVGRVALSWLPGGRPGGHDWHALPGTLSASLLLGTTSLAAIGTLGFDDLVMYVIVGLGVLLALIRAAAGPAAMTPRHEPPLAPQSWIAHVVTLAACVLIAVPIARQVVDFASVVFALAVLFLVFHALEVARCPNWARALGGLFLALVCASTRRADDTDVVFIGASFFCAGAACTVPWLRRADRRASTLAAIFYASPMLFQSTGWPLSVAGSAWLVIGTPAASRVRVASTAATCFIAAALLCHFGTMSRRTTLVPEVGTPAMALVAALFLIVAAARWHDARHARAGVWNPSGARVGHEESILLRTIVTALLLVLAARRFAPTLPVGDAVLPAMLVLALIAGLSLKRFARAPVARTAT